MTRIGSVLEDLRVACLLTGLVAALVYLNSLGNGFAYDDIHIVVQNFAIQSFETLPSALLEPYWPIDYGRELGLWRPVTTALLGIQWVLGDGSPLPFHIVNVGLHVAATVLTTLLLAELLTLPAAVVGGLVFAVHPVHVEAVANVIGVSEILSTVALLAACLTHVRGGAVTSWSRALAIGCLYLVGFGTKESGVTLPGLLFLLDAARGSLGPGDVPRYLRERWRLYLVLLVTALALLAARFAVLGSVASAFSPLGAQLLEEIPRIWTLGEIWLHYVRLWVFPLDLSADYSPNVIPISLGWSIDNTVGVVLALAILAVSLLLWRRPAMSAGTATARAAAFGVVWFLIAISPTSNALFLTGILLAERTLYLPSVGLAAATGWLITRWARERPRPAVALLAVVLLASSARTWTRNPAWEDGGTLITTMLRDVPHSGRSQWVLGDQFFLSGDASSALRSYRAAISLLGTSYQLLNEIARTMVQNGYYRGAERLYEFAVEENPEYPTAYRRLSASRAEQGDAEGTERWARAALERQEPGSDPARHHLLAWALAAQGRIDEAREQRRLGEEVGGRAVFWQGFMYEAYLLRASGDLEGAAAKVDTARLAARSEAGRAVVDSVAVSDFRLVPRAAGADSADSAGGGR